MALKHLQVFVESACSNRTNHPVSVEGKEGTRGQGGGKGQ